MGLHYSIHSYLSFSASKCPITSIFLCFLGLNIIVFCIIQYQCILSKMITLKSFPLLIDLVIHSYYTAVSPSLSSVVSLSHPQCPHSMQTGTGTQYPLVYVVRTTGSTVGSRCGDRRYTRDLQIFVLSPGLVPNESRDTFHRAQDSTVVSIHLYVSRYSHTLVVYLTADFILDENKQLWLISIPAVRDT